MTVVGNHEATPGNVTGEDGTTSVNVPFAAFTSRFEMPGAASRGNANFWFSWDHGPAHWVALSSEHDYAPGSAQLAWLAADLAAVNRSVTPWVIVSLHRPVYSSDADEWPSHSPGGPLATALEPLLAPAAASGGSSSSPPHVDLVIQGHMHCYERVHPVRNGTVVTPPTPGPGNTTLYVSPGAPVYVVQGTSGAVQRETFVDPPPPWSGTRSNGVYGFARLTLTGGTRLDWEFVDMYGAVQDAWAIVKGA
jgi:acid phosphatase type 7